MSFSANIAAFCLKANIEVRTANQKVAMDAFSRIIMKTPVDTGRARANWSCTIGAPATSTTEAKDQSGLSAVVAAAGVVNSWNGDGSIFLTNSLPYIRSLEYGGYPNPPKDGTGKTLNGFSIQAPVGMVRVTVEEVLSWIKRAVWK